VEDFWWFDSFLKEPRDLLFPWKAAVKDPHLKEQDLFFFPKEYGTFTGRGSGVRENGEALCASLFAQSSLENVPATELPNNVREMAEIINNEMMFDPADLLLTMEAPGLNSIFDFFDGIKKVLEGQEIVEVPIYQFFNDFLLLRANYVDKNQGAEIEVVYPILATVNTDQISIKIYKMSLPTRLSDQQVFSTVTAYISQPNSQPLTVGSISLEFNTVIQFFRGIKNQFDLNETALAPSYRIQVAGKILLVRNTFIDNEEQIYIIRTDTSNANRLGFFYFDIEVYLDLAQELMESDDDDPLNLSYWMGFEEIDPIFKTRAYTPQELLDFMQKRGMNLRVGQQDWTMKQNYITALCLFNDAHNQLFIYDAFYWNFSRTIKSNEDTWGEVQFDPLKNVGVSGSFHVLFKRYLDRILLDNNYQVQVILNPMLRL
jgi:hypothetical protein